MEEKKERDGAITKRELILRAAAEVFSRSGFHKATVEEIAQQAGVGKGTIYEYFSSKKQLFQELVVGGVEKLMMTLMEEINLVEGAGRKLQAIGEEILEIVERHKSLNRVLIAENINVVDDQKTKALMVEMHQKVIDLIVDVIREGIKAGEFRPVDETMAALMFIGGVKTAVSYPLIFGEEEANPPDVGEMLGLYFQGLQA